MRLRNRPEPLIQQPDLKGFFYKSIDQALKNQNIRAEDYTILYLVNLLTGFSRSENLFEQTEDGFLIKPLAIFFNESINAASPHERDIALQRLGDVALFIAGMFSQSLRKKLVDVDYYINMGGHAYASLADTRQRRLHGVALGEIFTELADKFVDFVDVLGEVGEGMASDTDLLHLYEVWLRTGSKRAESRLLKHGLQLTGDRNCLNRH